MKEQKKKRLIATLLLVSCLISGYMLFSLPKKGSRHLNNLARADTLIKNELRNFNIPTRQLRVSSTQIDSGLTRKTYYVRVPPAFSKTHFHSELNRKFHAYGIDIPAHVLFPEKNINMHLVFRGTVVRSVLMESDPELVLHQNRASIMVSFRGLPDEELVEKLQSLGEPIPLVLEIGNPMEANELKKQLNNRYNHLLFWFQTGEGEGLIKTKPNEALSKLKQLENVLPETSVLHFSNRTETYRDRWSGTDLTFVNAQNALLLHENQGKSAFLENLSKLRFDPDHNMAIIQGNETTLSWLAEKLPELKKAGLVLSFPPQKDY